MTAQTAVQVIEDQTVLEEALASDVKGIELISMTVICGTEGNRMTTVTLRVDGVEITHQLVDHEGGPVHAAILAIKTIIPNDLEFRSCNTKSQGAGSDAAALATVMTRAGDRVFQGRGAHVDTITACVSAYVEALSKYLRPT